MEVRKKLTPQNMKESLWELTNDVVTGAVDTNVAKTACTTCRSILQVVKTEIQTRAFNQSLSKNQRRVKF